MTNLTQKTTGFLSRRINQMVTGKRKGFDVGDISFGVSMPVPIFMDLGGQAVNLSQLNRVLGALSGEIGKE
ncbi:hypothetical protein GCM10007416_04770 [Kroppenstedtia guangzhouensis]|uniref:Uncharacterized protein n=1 Tax=Kroppenstedtia guangzhouensis TaxID=1274356 RepID=A0ABQ1G0A5_9BACL|nr:hypothetical protein GCM10007416_04770 [Kroppenstedtia guangzhouensis]